MKKSIYLINPKSDYPTYYGAEVIESMGYSPGVMMADLVIPTVASFIPDSFHIELCDEEISNIDFDIDADYIGITGKVNQKNRMIEISNEFRKRGKIVIMGGSFVSLSPNVMRKYCDILVRGEIEEIAEKLFNDLLNNNYKAEYFGTKPNLSLSPIPRWDLYPNHRAASGSIQTSRGCPYSCEFCDVIVYLGKKQRFKPIKKVLKELDILYLNGYRSVVFADDNFTVNRNHAKKLLYSLKDWNNKHNNEVRFITQVSTDIVKDKELMKICAEAGFNQVFIGIETPNSESMNEVKKYHNVNIEMSNIIKEFYKYGILPYCGMIVGFDSDKKDIFRKQFDLAVESSAPYFMINTLIAPDGTPLYERLKKDERIIENKHFEVGSVMESNIVFKNFSEEEVSLGMQWLSTNLYSVNNFQKRFLDMLDLFDCSYISQNSINSLDTLTNHVFKDISSIILNIKQLGKDEKKMLLTLSEKVHEKGFSKELFMTLIFFYIQLRYVFNENGVWSSTLIDKTIIN